MSRISETYFEGINITVLADGGIEFYAKAKDENPSLELRKNGQFVVKSKVISNDYDVYIAMKSWLNENIHSGLAPCNQQITLED